MRKLTLFIATLFLGIGMAVAQTPVVTLTDITREGAPYVLSNDDAAKIFALENLTVVLDITTDASLSGRGAFFCVADPTQEVPSSFSGTNTSFMACGHNAQGIAYIAAAKGGQHFSTGTIPANTKLRIAYVFDKTNNKFKAYIGDANTGWTMDRNFGDYEIATPKMVKEDFTNAKIYIGGGMANNAAHEMGDATIHQVSVYNGTLTVDQIKKLGSCVTNQSDFTEKAIYTFVTARGWMGAKDDNDNVISTAYASNGVTGNKTDANFQWTVYKSESGKYYLYNIGKGMFMGTEIRNNTAVPFAPFPTGKNLTFKNSTTTDYPMMFSTDGKAVVNHATDHQYGLISWTGGWDRLDDTGSNHKVELVGYLDETTLATIKELVAFREVGYYRLKGNSGNYIDASEFWGNEGQMSMAAEAACNPAGMVFLLDDDGRFLNYATGRYIQNTRALAPVDTKGDTWRIYKSATDGKYKLYSSAGSWLHDNSGNRADRCSTEGNHANSTHSWTLEAVTELPGVAMIDNTEYSTFDGALNAVQSNQTIKLLVSTSGEYWLREGVTGVTLESFGSNVIAPTIKEVVAKIGDVKFTTLAAAVTAVQAGQTLVLWADTDETFTLPVGVTLDKNGFNAPNVTVAPSFDGEGTAASPYLIDSADKLATLRDEVNGGEAYEGVYFKLTSDITLSGEWTAIGNGSRNGTGYTGNAFKGVFDGGNNTISGLTITTTTGAKAAIGLFGVVDGGTVKNLNLTDVNINVPSSDLAGAAIGMMLRGATAEAITVSGAIVGHDGVGGIVGRLIIDGTIANCTNNASVTSSYGGIGGIVGKPYYDDASNTSIFAKIDNCTNNGTITAPMYVGGIAGLARANVTNCVNEGAIVGGTQTGGIVGQLMAAGTVSGNENKAKVSGKNHLGGIIGDYSQSSDYHYYNVTIANNINRGELAATEQCAAILGCNNIDGFTAMTATGNQSHYYAEGLELFGNPEDMVIDATNKFIVPVAQVGTETYYTLADAAADAQEGDEIVMLADETLAEALTLPAGITFNGNGKQITGTIVAAGDITFAGVTKAGDLDFAVGNTVVNIPAGASLQLNGSARMSIGFGTTFNIVGTIADAKTADKATIVPSLVIPGASFSGAGVKFNVTNAYISVPSSYCSTSKSASGTFDFNITNSIWESAGKLAFEEQSVNAKVDFALVNSVLTTGSHLVFGTASGEEGVVIDNSLVNEGTSRQLENCGTMTIKNGSIVNGAVATSSNAKNPGTVIVDNATYAVTGEFSGSDLGTGTLIIKKGANVSVGSIKAGANVTVDAEGMAAGDEINFTANLSQFTGTLSVINNDKLDAQIVDGKVVLAAKPAAKIGEQKYATLDEAVKAAKVGDKITLLDDADLAFAHNPQYNNVYASEIDLNGKTMTMKKGDVRFDNVTIKNGNIIVQPGTYSGTAIFLMYSKDLTLDGVKVTATGVAAPAYLIGLEGTSNLNLLNGSEIAINNESLVNIGSIIADNGNGNTVTIKDSKIDIKNSNARLYLGGTNGNITVENSDIDLNGVKEGFYLRAGQTLAITGTSTVDITLNSTEGRYGINLTDLTATYTKAETATVNATVYEIKVAKIGDVEFKTLQEAVDAVQEGETITLIYNVVLAERVTIPANKTLTIDLNGKSISMEESIIATAYAINNLGNLTITDGVGGGSINARGVYNGYGDGGANVTDATITISGGTFNAKGTNGGAAIFNYGTANVYGGKFTSIGGYSLNNQAGAKMNITDGVEVTGGIYNNQDAELTVDGGNISNNRSGCHTIYAWNAKVTVNGGSIHNENSGNATIMSAGTSVVTINGGTISIKNGRVPGNGNTWTSCLTDAANTAKIIVNDGTLNGGFRVQAGSSMTINGGSFNDVYGSNYNIYGTVTVTGGTFTDDTAKAFATKYVKAGYVAAENNGNYTVVEAPAYIEGKASYVSLAAAYEAAVNGDVIVLNESVTTFPVINKAVTFKGGKENAAVEINYALSQNFTAIDGTVRFENLTFNKPLFTEHGGNKPGLSIEFEGCNFNVNSEAGYGILVGTSWSNSVVKGLKVNNCNFKYVGTEFKGGYMLYVQCVNEVTITNNTIDGNNLYRGAIHLGDATEHATVATVSNNTIKNFCRGVMMGNRVAGSSATISGNTFDNINYSDKDSKPAQECAPIFIHSNATAEALQIALTDNKVENCTNPMIYSEDTDLIKYYVTEFTGNTVGGAAVELANSYNAPNQIFPVATINDAEYFTLQAAVNAVKNGETITLTSDVTENVTLTEKTGFYYTIDGAGKTMKGSINVASLSDTEDNRRITIKNIKFVDTADADVDFISSVNTNHYPRLTIEGCTFTGSGNDGDVAVRLKSSHSVVIKDCQATGLHSFIQNTSGWNLTIENVTVTDSKSGFALGTVQGVTVKGCEADVKGYGIRLDANTYNNNAVIESNKIEAFIPVVVRKANTESNITVKGTNTFNASNRDGLWMAVGTSEYEENGQMPTAATGKVVVTLNNTNLDNEGIYGDHVVLAGKGTEAEPYLISDIKELVAFRNYVNSGANYYAGVWVALAADIDMAGENWIGIGSATADHGFMGNFDGKNFKFKNLTITNPALDSDDYAYAGLFGVTEGTDKNNQNIIKNLTIENVTITTTGHIAAAAIAYAYYTIVDNVKVCGDIKIQGGDYTAGVLAYTRRCVNASNLAIVGNEGSFVEGNQVVGGVISDIQMNGGLTAVYNNFSAEGITVSGKMRVGGISGIIATQTLNGATVKNVTLNSEDKFAGVVAGCLGGTSTITGVVAENVTGATTLIGATYDAPKAVQAKIGDTYYATLEAAYKAAQEGETITMLAPVVIASGETLTLDKNVTVVYTSNVAGEDMFTNRGTLNISAGTITYANTDATGSNVTVSTISSEPGSVLNITGGTVENKTVKADGSSIYSYAIDMLTNGSLGDVTATIEGGTVYSDYMAIRQFNNGTACKNSLTINGGYIYGAKRAVQVHLNNNAAYTTISGGKVEAGADGYAICNFAATGNLEVTGGEFIGAVYSARENFISGGIYDAEVYAGYCAEGYMPNKNVDGTYGVVLVANAYASIDGVTYGSLKAAVAAAKKGETIVLLQDINEGIITIEKSLTLDGAGKTITGHIHANLGNTKMTVKNVNFNGDNATYDYAIRVDRANHFTAENCTADGYKYSFLYANKSNNNFTIKDVTVTNCANYGVYFASFNNATVENLTVIGAEYGVAAGNAANSKVNIKNCTFDVADVPLYIQEKGTGKVTFTFDGVNEMGNEVLYTNEYVKIVAVAQVGTKVYDNFAQAFAGAQDGQTVKLLSNISLGLDDVVVNNAGQKVLANVDGKNITFDMNGKKIAVDHRSTEAADRIFSVICVEDGAGLTVTGNGSIDVTTGVTDANVMPKVAYMFWKRGTTGYLVIEDGNYHMDNSEDSMVYTNGDNIVTVNGGTFILDANGTRVNGFPWIFNVAGNDAASLNVTGGTYNYDIRKQFWAQEVKLAEGLTMRNNGDGTWTVVDAIAAVIGADAAVKESYGSIQEAINAAQDGETVKLLADVAYADADALSVEEKPYSTMLYVQGKNITLDLNGNNIDVTYTGSLLYSVVLVSDGAGLTVTGEGSINVRGLKADGTAAKNIAYVFWKRGTTGYLVIENGTFHMNDAADSMVYTNGDEIVTINGGTFILDAVASQTNGFPVIFNAAGNNEQQIVVNGGTFNYDINHQIRPFEPYVAPEKALKKVQIDGVDMWTIVPAEAYVTEMLGAWVTEPGNNEHKVGYATFTEAIAAVNNLGKTVTLVKDVELTKTLALTDMELTLDGAGHTISQADDCNNAIALFDITRGKVAINNVVFDGIKKGAVVRTVGTEFAMDNVTAQNCEHTVGQGMFRLLGQNTITNSTFKNNTCTMVMTLNFDGASDTPQVVDNCVFEGNTANGTAVLYYVTGANCTITDSEFIGNTVNCNNNGATIYLGFQENCSVTGNLFKENVVTDASTSTRVAGAIFFGYEAEISGNAFDNNTASNANGDVLGQVCSSLYYEGTIDLSGNYWGAEAPVYGKDYTIQHQTGEGTFALTNYYTGYSLENGNVVLNGESAYEVVIEDGQFESYTNAFDMEVASIIYKRTLNTGWNALYVPFEIPVDVLTALGYEVAFFYDVHFEVLGGGEINPESAPDVHLIKIKEGTLKANFPYVIRASQNADSNMSLVLNDVTLSSTAASEMNSVEAGSTINRFIFAGTYTKSTREQLTGDTDIPCYAITPRGTFQKMSATAKLTPFRVFMYIVAKDGSPVILNDVAAQSIQMRVIGEENEDGTTLIYDVENDVQTIDYIYDLQGRRVLEPQKGNLYIINGKKVIF